jgi:hypothetical protein
MNAPDESQPKLIVLHTDDRALEQYPPGIRAAVEELLTQIETLQRQKQAYDHLSGIAAKLHEMSETADGDLRSALERHAAALRNFDLLSFAGSIGAWTEDVCGAISLGALTSTVPTESESGDLAAVTTDISGSIPAAQVVVLGGAQTYRVVRVEE